MTLFNRKKDADKEKEVNWQKASPFKFDIKVGDTSENKGSKNFKFTSMNQYTGSAITNKSATNESGLAFGNGGDQLSNNKVNSQQSATVVDQQNLLDLEAGVTKQVNSDSDLLDLFGGLSVGHSVNLGLSTSVPQSNSDDIHNIFGGLSLVNDQSNASTTADNKQAIQGNSIDDLFGLQFN